MFLAWLVAAVIEARKQRSAAEKILGEHRGWLAVISCIVGLAFLVAAGYLIVTGARGIAIAFGMDEFIVGATIVAIGTSAPELATVIIAKLRGHEDVGLGTILGSNIFNGLFIVAVAAVIYPISVNWREVAVALVLGFVGGGTYFPYARRFYRTKKWCAAACALRCLSYHHPSTVGSLTLNRFPVVKGSGFL
jgi:cation:H+ antiporter